MSINSTMTALADEVRELSGKTGKLTLAGMTTEVAGGNDKISAQTDLISQIKAALEGKAGGGGGIVPTGTKEITENGEYDVTAFAKVDVEVPDVPAVVDELDAKENGTYRAADDGLEGYSVVTVNVPSEEPVLQEGSATPTKSRQTVEPPSGVDGFSKFVVEQIPDEYIVPEDIVSISFNGIHNVSKFAQAYVDVPDIPAVTEELNVTENGTYEPDDGVDGFSKVTVNVPSSGGGDTGLPAGYRRVDYIQFTGAQLVDTGIVGTQDTQINASFTWESSTKRHLFGCASSDNTASVTSYMNGSWRFGNKSQTKQVSSKNEKLPYSCLINKTTISLNSSVTAISGLNDFETVGTLLLGGARDSDGSLPSVGITGKVFYFMLWNGDEQVQKLVPVVSADGVYRFFDLVTKTFFDSITDTPLGGGSI